MSKISENCRRSAPCAPRPTRSACSPGDAAAPPLPHPPARTPPPALAVIVALAQAQRHRDEVPVRRRRRRGVHGGVAGLQESAHLRLQEARVGTGPGTAIAVQSTPRPWPCTQMRMHPSFRQSLRRRSAACVPLRMRPALAAHSAHVPYARRVRVERHRCRITRDLVCVRIQNVS